jgi:hypothetical protein
MNSSDDTAPTPSHESWVDDMHEHFSTHGYYRALDLQRVLGDPGEPVVAHVSVGFGNNYPTKD